MTSQNSIPSSSPWIDRGLLVVRIALGVVFLMHGGQKLFVYGHAGVTAAMASLGLPFPGLNAYLITAAELGGGLALLFGALTRPAAAVLAFSMVVAIVSVHLRAGFFAPAGFEYPLTLLLGNLALLMTGGGKYAFDAKMRART